MLLSLTPEAPLPTILFTLTFPSPLPESLPLPTAWDSHLQIVNNLQLSVPPDVHALDKSAAWVSLVDTVNFDLSTLTLTCTFIDRSKEEWPLSSACVFLLEKVISDVNRSAREAEAEAEDCHVPSAAESPFNSASVPWYPQKQSASASTSTSSLSPSVSNNANGSIAAADAVVTVKSPKPKKRRSILAALVASLVLLPSSRNATPASTRPPSPNSQPSISPSDGSLRSATAISPSPSSQNELTVQSQPEIITPPPGVPISRFLRRRARSTLVDAFRRFVLPELSTRYRSELAKTNPHVTLPLGGPFYALWVTRSTMRAVVAEMGHILMGSCRGNDAMSSAGSSPLDAPTGLGDPLDDCTTTDESSVHSIPEQPGMNSGGAVNANFKMSSPISSLLKRKITPELSSEAYDVYTSLRETYIRLRSLSSQLEAHVQAENHIECVGSKQVPSVDEENNGLFADFFDPACAASPDKSWSSSPPSGLRPNHLDAQLTSAEVKSRRRAWSTRSYLVSGWETYHGSPPRRLSGLSSHKRSYSEPAPSTLRGGSPMGLIGLSMPARPSPLSQVWVHELEQEPLADDHDVEDEGVYVGSAGRGKSKWNWSFDGGIGIGRRKRESPSSSSLSASGPGHRRERCVSMITPSSKTGSTKPSKANREVGCKKDYTGVGSGFRGVHVPQDVEAVDVDDDMEAMEDVYDVDVGIHEVDFQIEVDDEARSKFATRGFHDFNERQQFAISRSSSANTTSRDSDHFDFHAYSSSRDSAYSSPSSFSQMRSGSRALRHFRYGYGAEYFPADHSEEDAFDQDDNAGYDGNDTDLEYEYCSRSRTSGNGDDDTVESGLYRKPSLEEFILPHPRSRVNSGLDVAPLVDDVTA